MGKRPDDQDRPSRHGKILGEHLSLIALAGRKDLPFELPDMCATCAFREGSMPNQMAATGKVALDCALGVDKDRFACHHGMKDGEPQKICVGYVAARCAPFSFVRDVMRSLKSELDAMSGLDEVQAEFDVWVNEVDPMGEMNEYELATRFARRHPGFGPPK